MHIWHIHFNGILQNVPEASDAYRFHTRPKEGRCRQVMADLFCTHRHGDQDWFEIGGPKAVYGTAPPTYIMLPKLTRQNGISGSAESR